MSDKITRETMTKDKLMTYRALRARMYINSGVDASNNPILNAKAYMNRTVDNAVLEWNEMTNADKVFMNQHINDFIDNDYKDKPKAKADLGEAKTWATMEKHGWEDHDVNFNSVIKEGDIRYV